MVRYGRTADSPSERMTKLTRSPTPKAADVESADATPAVSQWYWVRKSKDEDDSEGERWFGCVLHVGSNYAKLGTVDGNAYERVHFDEWAERCEFVPIPDPIIDGHVREHQAETMRLMAEVRAITARLAVTPGRALGPGGATESTALALRNHQTAKDYKKALVRAKDKELPELFQHIEQSNLALGQWMKAKTLPLMAHEQALRSSIDAIDDRIFNVELYAGLVETVTCVKNGAPAPIATPIHLMQRRCYMDEECLAEYQAGGMSFKNLRAFDRWIGRPTNFKRILPFPRCVVAFQVRRNDRDWRIRNFIDFFQMLNEKPLDKLTFLYIRNGDQLHRLATELELGPQLFPDPRSLDRGQLWAKIFVERVDKIITNDEYEALQAEAAREEQEHSEQFRHRFHDDYQPFTPASVYYDDIGRHLADEMTKHNRLVIVLQGLLDRSPVLHPHPPWSLWTEAGFAAALSLVYDDSRALAPADLPDFEAYRAKLNAELRVGSVTTGQQLAWEQHNARKEEAARDRHYHIGRFVPEGNAGPGLLARPATVSKRSQMCTFTWTRERLTGKGATVPCRFTVNAKQLLNVDAYQLGDFRIFYRDPRTRAEYLKWAPLLLLAEDYHAGKREAPPLAPRSARPAPSKDGQRRYRERKRRLALRRQAVRLVRAVTLRSGDVYAKGTLWRVGHGRGDHFTLHGITKDGRTERTDGEHIARYIIHLHSSAFVVDGDIPPEPADEES
jgi:hypothetical protein